MSTLRVNSILNSAGTGPTSTIQSGTAQNTTSGTAIDFTGIPAGVKRITVMLNGVSTNGASQMQIQMGSGSVDTSATYSGSVSYGGAGATNYFSTGFQIIASGVTSAALNFSGSISLVLFGSNTWCETGIIGVNSTNAISMSGGAKALSGALDRIRLTTVNGTDTFDAGSVNILYES